MKNAILWNVPLCRTGEPTFRRNVSPPSSGYKNLRARNQREQVAADIFCPEDEGDKFLRNVVSHKIYTAPTSQETAFFMNFNSLEKIQSLK
jgi:hypothetical protein